MTKCRTMFLLALLLAPAPGWAHVMLSCDMFCQGPELCQSMCGPYHAAGKPTCTPEALVSMLKALLEGESISTDPLTTTAVYRSPAQILRDAAARMEARDARLTRAMALVQACETKGP